MDGRSAPTRKHPQPDLNHIHHRQHQEQASHHRSNRRRHHPESQRLQIYVSPKYLVHLLAVQQIDRQFQPLRHQRREQEEAERNHLEHQQLLRDVNAGVAPRPVLQAVLPRRRQRQPHEHRDREEGVHIHQAVQRRHVDARRGRHRVGFRVLVFRGSDKVNWGLITTQEIKNRARVLTPT